MIFAANGLFDVSKINIIEGFLETTRFIMDWIIFLLSKLYMFIDVSEFALTIVSIYWDAGSYLEPVNSLVSPTNFISSKYLKIKLSKSKFCWAPVTLLQVTKSFQIMVRLEILGTIIQGGVNKRSQQLAGNK